jgi:hypothetical protein
MKFKEKKKTEILAKQALEQLSMNNGVLIAPLFSNADKFYRGHCIMQLECTLLFYFIGF